MQGNIYETFGWRNIKSWTLLKLKVTEVLGNEMSLWGNDCIRHFKLLLLQRINSLTQASELTLAIKLLYCISGLKIFRTHFSTEADSFMKTNC